MPAITLLSSRISLTNLFSFYERIVLENPTGAEGK